MSILVRVVRQAGVRAAVCFAAKPSPAGFRRMSSLDGSKTVGNLKDAFAGTAACLQAFPICRGTDTLSAPHVRAPVCCTETSYSTHSDRGLFAGKCMAQVRYQYMAQQADVEGFTDAASVFRAVAESEENHALGHLEFLQETGDPVSSQPIGKS